MRSRLAHVFSATDTVDVNRSSSDLADILHPRKALLLISGEAKAEPMRRLTSRAIATDFPASVPWWPSALAAFRDRAAAAKMDVNRHS